MTLTELRYIVALAQEQHFGRAAERCHVSQPTLSIAIRKLESELNVALFERNKQGALITPLGLKIAAVATGVLEQTARIKDIADADKEQLEGPLALGTLPSIGPYLLPQFIPLLQETAPKLSLYVEENNQAALGLRLRGGELDAILVATPFSEPDVVTQPLFDEPFMLLLPAHHRLAHKQAIAAEDLDPKELLLLSEGHVFREQVLAAFPHLRGDHEAAAGARHFMQTILPQAAAHCSHYTPDLLITRPFVKPVPKRTLALAWRVSFPRHKAIDLLRQAIQAASSAYWNYDTARAPAGQGVLVENRDW